MHHALTEAPAGSVLVVEITGDEPCQRALIGDIIAYAAKKKGLAGLITNGVRPPVPPEPDRQNALSSHTFSICRLLGISVYS
eukprot:SAG22_NODE_1237_length_5050_cov_1.625404_2_plen_82_part_00